MTIKRTASFIPIPADDLVRDVSLYDAPGEAYDGVLAIEYPPGVAAGLTPDQSWFGAQTMNAIWQTWARALDAVIDSASFQVVRLPYDSGGDRLDYSDVDGTGLNTNSDGAQPPLLFVGSNGWIYTQLEHKNGHVGDAAIRKYSFWGSGLGLLSDTPNGIDEDAWTNSADWPGLTPAESGRAVVLGSDRASAYLIALGDTRTVSVSADRGDTWSAAAALPNDANWTKPLAAHCMGTTWLVVDYCPTTTNVNRLNISDGLAAGSWSTVNGTLCGGDAGGTVRRITANSSVAIFLPQQNTKIGRWEVGDTDVSNITLADPDTGLTRWRGAWNEQIQEFLIGNAQGDLWAADALAETWTQVNHEESEGFGAADIVPHGRGFVIANSQGNDIWYVHYNQLGAIVKTRIASGFQGSVSPSYFHLAAIDGRWVAARVNYYGITGGGGALRYVLEVLHSDRQSWDIEGIVGR